jgi:hypothetical protein
MDGQFTMPAGTTVTGGAGDNSNSPKNRDASLHIDTNRLINRRNIGSRDTSPRNSAHNTLVQ